MDYVSTLYNIADAYGNKGSKNWAMLNWLDTHQNLRRANAAFKVKKAFGIHPLVTYGAQPQQAPPQRTGGRNDAMARAMLSMTRGAKSKAEDRIIQAEARKAEAEASMMEHELQNMGQISDQPGGTGLAPHGQGQGDVPRVDIVPKQQTAKLAPGTEAGSASYWQYVEDADGGIKAMISKEISEPMESDWSASWEHAGKTAVNALKDWSHLNSADRNKLLLNQRPPSHKKGYEYRYSRWKRKWYLQKKVNGKSRLYLK